MELLTTTVVLRREDGSVFRRSIGNSVGRWGIARRANAASDLEDVDDGHLAERRRINAENYTDLKHTSSLRLPARDWSHQ